MTHCRVPPEPSVRPIRCVIPSRDPADPRPEIAIGLRVLRRRNSAFIYAGPYHVLTSIRIISVPNFHTREVTAFAVVFRLVRVPVAHFPPPSHHSPIISSLSPPRRYPIHIQEAVSAMVIPPGSRMSMGGGDHLLYHYTRLSL
ncbi:hypothetical protein EVAR_48747_1 [Eumeta japonica]|uniref:Uncharacterized protein n=1 Tax=Eumeta variegata TaxID=151549 RepID=A0A4C1YKW3_EUMVA|nr:hypothetical protein EVAR_48747_1 [Eumeta japonica]